MKKISLNVLFTALALSLFLNGCGASTSQDVCPKFYKIKAEEPKTASQAKGFRQVSFKNDTGVPVGTAICSINNGDSDHISLGAIWMMDLGDYSRDRDAHWQKFEDIELHNNRVLNFYGENNESR